MILEFDDQKLFGNPTYHLDTLLLNESFLNDKSSNRVYIENRFEYLDSHNTEQRLQALKNNWDPEAAERLDVDFKRACKHAAKQCKKKPNIAHVKKLRSLQVKKNMLLRVISQYKTGRNLLEAIAFQVRHGHDFTIPDTLEECQKECRETQSTIRKAE